MELAVVSEGSGSDVRQLDGVVARLIGGRWTRVHGGPASAGLAGAVAHRLSVPVECGEQLDLNGLIADNPGGRVVAIADGASIRELVSAVMEVDVAALPIPQPLSLTHIRASRNGTRTVRCLNDTLHTLDQRTEEFATTRERRAQHD